MDNTLHIRRLQTEKKFIGLHASLSVYMQKADEHDLFI